MKIIGFPKEDHRFERESLENHLFFKGKLTEGRNGKDKKSTGKPAGAIGVLRIFKSSVFA